MEILAQSESELASQKLLVQARNIVLRQLSSSAKSRAQLAEVLSRKQIPEEIAQQALDELTDAGLVDDLAFAQLLVRSRCATKKVSRTRLVQQLRQKGISEELIEIAISVVTDERQASMALELAERKIRQLSSYPREVIERRTYGLLLRRGYSYGMSLHAVRQALAKSSE